MTVETWRKGCMMIVVAPVKEVESNDRIAEYLEPCRHIEE